MNSPSPTLTPPGRSNNKAVPPPVRPPLGQRLSVTLRSQLSKNGGCLGRLELSLVHTLAAGAGGSTQWRVRAVIGIVDGAIQGSMADQTKSRGRPAPAAVMMIPPDRPAGVRSMAKRTVGMGACPQGPAMDELWRWLEDATWEHRLPPPTLDERIAFGDAAPAATLEVIRHRVLRSAAVLERLPASLEVRLSRRMHSPDPTGSTGSTGLATMVPIVRLIATFPGRDAAQCSTRVVLWSEDRMPALVALLRDCARRLDPRSTMLPRTGFSQRL